MRIAFDETKRQSNIAKHGLDFATVTVDFFIDAVVLDSRAGRYMAINELNGEMVVTIIFAPLGSEAISIVSMRRASRKERAIYAKIA